MSEQRFHEVRVRFQSERARHGFYRAAVVFSWRRAKRAVRFGVQDAAVAAAVAWVAHSDRVAKVRAEQSAHAIAELSQAFHSGWGVGATVGV